MKTKDFALRIQSDQPDISMSDVHRIVKGYFQHKPWIYWFDFLVSFAIGLAAYAIVPLLGLFTWQ